MYKFARQWMQLVVLLLLVTVTVVKLYLTTLTGPDVTYGKVNVGYGDDATCETIKEQPEHWQFPAVPPELQSVSQDNPKLIRHLCEKWILPPFSGDLQLEEPDVEHYSQRRQSQTVDKLLDARRDGFFLECGAANGEGFSNSLFFEKSRNWTGLLIEVNPMNFAKMRATNRHSYMINSCLSPSPETSVLRFQGNGYIGGLSDFMSEDELEDIKDKKGRKFLDLDIQCFPLYSILRAMGIERVDYFSLDIEGAELEVLKTIPLNDIFIEVISIEYRVRTGAEDSDAKLKSIVEYLEQYGYQVITTLGGEDVVLRKPDHTELDI